jgi:hypothetical protein
MRAINLDADGTFVNFYGVDGWLDYLVANDATPYRIAKPLINMRVLARYLNRLQRKGYSINIISWLSKNSTNEFDKEVTTAKLEWFKKHLPSVKWDSINIVPYGTPKSLFGEDVLIDDEEPNRIEWELKGGKAYDAKDILEVLRNL